MLSSNALSKSELRESNKSPCNQELKFIDLVCSHGNLVIKFLQSRICLNPVMSISVI